MNPLHLAFILIMGGACLATFVTSETLHAADMPSAQIFAQHLPAGPHMHRALR